MLEELQQPVQNPRAEPLDKQGQGGTPLTGRNLEQAQTNAVL